ncbi:hypothetical protein GCM10025880_44650 [Methylorubrum aminovorans]|nr:hypothetical protein GCM10025880_44650 [Methylorubrum aminovorans]
MQACTTALRPTVTRSPIWVGSDSVAMWTVERAPSQKRSPAVIGWPSLRITLSSPSQAWDPRVAVPITVLARPHQTGRLAKTGRMPSWGRIRSGVTSRLAVLRNGAGGAVLFLSHIGPRANGVTGRRENALAGPSLPAYAFPKRRS